MFSTIVGLVLADPLEASIPSSNPVIGRLRWTDVVSGFSRSAVHRAGGFQLTTTGVGEVAASAFGTLQRVAHRRH